MKIGVVGLGYVGLVTATVLADEGNHLICVDIDKEKIDSLRRGIPTIFEPGLDDLLKKNRDSMTFSTDYGTLADADAIFVAVATPDRDGKINLDYIFSAMNAIKTHSPSVPVAVKSTVVPGSALSILERTGITVVSNPEFLREGNAIADTVRPDRIVIGGAENEKKLVFKKIWEFTGAPVIDTTNENAELIKYASNAFLATKISFINEIADLCEKIPGGDVRTVAKGMGFDKRIAPHFLNAGLGFGGSCFPKDTQAILSYSREIGEELSIVKSSIQVNSNRVSHNLDRVESNFGKIEGKNVCLLGVAFKDDTDDVRSSKSWELAREMQRRGARVLAFDPVVNRVEGLKMSVSSDECVEQSEIVMIATEWNVFKDIDFRGKPVVDFRGLLKDKVASMAVGRNVQN